MKFFYMLLNIILFLLALVLLVLNLSFRPRPPDKILSSAPDTGGETMPAKALKFNRELAPNPSGLWENNLFSQYRTAEGGGGLPGAGARPVGLELLGVCRFGDEAGVIILDRQTAPSAVVPSLSRPRGAAVSGTQPGALAPSGSGTSKFCRIGERLDSGFILTEVTGDTAVFSRGREQIVLKIDLDSESSIRRNASAASATSSKVVKEENAPPVQLQPPAGISAPEAVQPQVPRGSRPVVTPQNVQPAPDQKAVPRNPVQDTEQE